MSCSSVYFKVYCLSVPKTVKPSLQTINLGSQSSAGVESLGKKEQDFWRVFT